MHPFEHAQGFNFPLPQVKSLDNCNLMGIARRVGSTKTDPCVTLRNSMTEREKRFIYELCECDQQNKARGYANYIEETRLLAERMLRDEQRNTEA